MCFLRIRSSQVRSFSNLVINLICTWQLQILNSEINCPNDLLYKAAIERAKELDMKFVSIGGGTTTDLNDGLFRFKSKYGNIVKDVFIGKKNSQPKNL